MVIVRLTRGGNCLVYMCECKMIESHIGKM
jgi:hypothetical protein